MSKNPVILVGICLFLILSLSRQGVAQQQFGHDYHYHLMDIGLGMGMDYGGLVGAKLAFYMPFRQISVFGAGGLQLFGIGWNVGTTFRLLSMKKSRTFRPNIKIMYGINRSTYVDGASEYNAMFTGWTPGIGAEFRFGKKRASGFDVDLNVPIGSDKFKNQINMIESDPQVGTMIQMPVAISIGYHREF
ncbi:MAG: hypothetical protein IPN08_17340 [Bacteroidales bacterium]|nr:hypothetical protein [Bacteroidales bacterium]